MRLAGHLAVCIVFCFGTASLSQASEDAELKDPYLVEIAKFAAAGILQNAADLGISNNSALHRIMDAHIVPFPQPQPVQYMLNLELGVGCSSEGTCSGDRQICEVLVLDEPWAKKHTIEEERTSCADREPNGPLEFIDTSSTIATSLPLESATTKALSIKAVLQMGDRRGGKHTLKHIGQARKVKMEESNTNLYYLTIYISTLSDDSTSETCEVTMEEALPSNEQTLQSFRCFAMGDKEGGDKFGIARVPPEELTSALMQHAVLASLAIIDAESTSQFQLKVIGYSLADSRVSVDSGARDLNLRLGIVPTLCIKRPESSDDDDEAKSCAIDVERDPSMCSITLTQWPWITDGNLFSDLDCEPTNYAVISEELEAYTDDDSSTPGEEGPEVEEVTSNAVQSSNRRENVEEEDTEPEDEEGREVEEEVFVARTGPCSGCPVEMDVDSPAVKEMAEFVLSALESAANSDKVLSVARVVKATSQVVSGSLYSLTIELVDTDCERSENVDRLKCVSDPVNGVRRTCTVRIWDQSWLNSKQIREPDCDTANAEVESRSLKTVAVGGNRETMVLSPDDEDVKAVAAFALNRLDAFDDNSKKRILTKIIEATSNSVARSRTYHVKIQVALSDCPESSDPNDPDCQAGLVRSAGYLCDVQVLAQPGADRFVPKRLVDSKCYPSGTSAADSEKKDLTAEGSENSRVSAHQQNSPTGASANADKESPYIRSIAQFATAVINQRSNGNSLKLARVVRAETQLVAGKKVTLDVEVGFTNCTKDNANGNCHIDGAQESVICRVTVWDRAWLNDRRVTNLTCNSLPLSSGANQEGVPHGATTTSGLPAETVGAAADQDHMSVEIEAYADFALAVVEEQSNAEKKLKMVKILASSIQVVQGKNVRLTLEVASTRCKRDESIDDDCPVDEAKERQICNIQIWDRPWLQEKQVTDLNCQPKRPKPGRASRSEDVDESPFTGEAPSSFRLGEGVDWIEGQARQDAQEHLPVLGGYAAVDVNDDSVEEMANFAAAFISQAFTAQENSQPYSVIKVHSASKQIVAGVNYKLELEVGRPDGALICNVIVFDQSWTSTRQVTNMTCFPQAFPHAAEFSAKPTKGSAVGGFKPAEINSAAVREAVSFAVDTLAKESLANNTTLTLMRVGSAAKQMAADQVNYKLKLQILQTKSTVVCDVIVADPIDTTAGKKLVSSSCTSAKKQRQLAGGYSPLNVDDENVKEMASFAADAISEASNEGTLALREVTSALRQIVSGVNYKITIQVEGATGIQICNAVVYDQSWTKTRKLSSFDCKDLNGVRTNRQLPKSRRPIRPNNSELSVQPPPHCQPGGYCPVDPDEKAVKEMANFAASSLSQSSNAGPLALVKVRSANRQVVAGFNYKLELELSNGAGNKIVCLVVVFDQAWTSTRRVSHSECSPVASSPVARPVSPSPAVRKPDDSVLPLRVHNLGAYENADPEEDSVIEMATFATNVISQSSNAGPLNLVKIASASKQIVAGVNYKLTIELTGSAGTQVCDVVVYDQSWTKTRTLSSSNCTRQEDDPKPSPAEAVSEEGVESATPAEGGESRLEGEYVSVDTTEETVQDVAAFATTLVGQIRNAGDLTLRKVLSASRQTNGGGFSYRLGLELAGVKEPLLTCDVIVFDNEKARQLAYSSCAAMPTPAGRRKRSSERLAGGVLPFDIASSKVKTLSALAVSAVTLRSNEPNAPSAVHVIKATQQVVSGTVYNLEMEIEFVDCLLAVESCTRRQRCNVSIWEQPWMQRQDVTKLSCDDSVGHRNEPLMAPLHLGKVIPVDTESEEILASSGVALQAVQVRSNARNQLRVVRIKSAATQAVAGKKTFLTMEIGQTKCPLTDSRPDEHCPFDDRGGRQMCKIAIWTRPWLNDSHVTSVSCAPIVLRIRRDLEVDEHHHHQHHHRRAKGPSKKVRRLKHMTAFRAYIKNFKKIYKTWDEFEKRYRIYRANQEKIALLNMHEMGTAEYGDTPFSDWSAAEYKQHLAGLNSQFRLTNEPLARAVIPKVDLPDEFDWRHFNVVTPVKNQGSCGSCWAFSVTGNVEGVYGVQHGELLSLSEQELVDCDKLDSGCNGGLPENAYKAIQELGGLEIESDYPYNGHQNACKLDTSITRVQVTGGVEISSNETEMAQWLVQNGPISIGINANGMQFYRGGISHPWKVLCRPGGIDHGVLIVGYGVAEYPKFNKTLPYWIVKNSWGTSWGEQGYYRVFRGDGTCGLNMMATSAVVA